MNSIEAVALLTCLRAWPSSTTLSIPFSNEPELAVLRILASLPLLTATRNLASAQTIIGTSSVIDGDTIEIRGERIRLHP